MKIMHLISGGDVGGAKTHVLSLLRELGKEHKVKLVCFIDGPFAQEARDMGIPTRILKHKNPLLLRSELLDCVRRGQYDLLHCHGSKANVYSAWVRKKLGIPMISTVHSDPKLDYLGRPLADMTYGVMNRLSLSHRDGWVAVSDSMKDLLISRGFPGDSIWPIYNGIEFPDKIPHKPRQEYLRSLGLDWDESCVIFGIAARIASVKDLPTLVKAFAIAVKAAPNARLLIAGDGEQRPAVEQLSKELCPEGTVHFAGWQEDMNSFYHALDVNMLSSISETFPYAITEGARMYCATISTAVGGVPKLVVDGDTGFLVDPGDFEAMGARMIRLAEDARLRADLGRALYEKVRSDYSVESMAARQVKIYESVLIRRMRSSQGRYGAVICGAYGRGNAGDDSILMTMIRQLRQEDPNLPICVLSRRPKDTAAMTGVSSVHLFDFRSAGKQMKKSALYISGGGSLIQNATSNRSLMFYLSSIAQAAKNGCRVMMYGCGIGPVTGGRYQRLVKRGLQRYVDLITLRDPESRETLTEFGVTTPEIHVTADPAMLMQGDQKAADRYLEHNGLDPEGKYCMFVLRPWGDDAHQKLKAVCAAAEHVWKQYGLRPVFFSFEPNRDQEINALAASMMKVPCTLLPPISDGTVLCGLISRMKLVVSMRLHALIFACSQQTRIVGISYDPKVSGFMNYLGSDNCVELSEVTAEKLKEKIDSALTEREMTSNLNHMKALAAENGYLAGKLIKE